VGQIRTIGVMALLATAAMLAMAGTAGATQLDYPFNSSNEGWQVNQDPAGSNFMPAMFRATGGNPGGRLTVTDTGSDDGCPNPGPGDPPCELVTFYSPFVAPLTSNYGGIASFDLRSSVDPQFAAEFLLLAEGSQYLDGLITETPGTGYHHLSINLTEAGSWFVCPYAGGSCSRPSQTQFVSLITATDEVAVIADVGPNGTSETYDLDNVVVTEGGGLPPPAGGPPTAKKHKKCKKKRNRAATAKKGKCKKKRKRRTAVAALRG
jgi:hypothetical protein